MIPNELMEKFIRLNAKSKSYQIEKIQESEAGDVVPYIVLTYTKFDTETGVPFTAMVKERKETLVDLKRECNDMIAYIAQALDESS